MLLTATLLLALGSPQPQRAEVNDIPRGAKKIEYWGHGTLDYDFDPEWWRIGAGHSGSAYLQIDTGVGALCGCPHGDAFAPVVVVYDRYGFVLGSLVASNPGSAGLLLTNLPLGEPVWLVISGQPTGPSGTSEYSLSLY